MGSADIDIGDIDGSAEPDSETIEDELGSLELALSTSCGSTGPVQRTFTARATAFTATGMLQAQGCQGDSYMFAIQSYNNGLSPLQNPRLRAATSPANQAECEATQLRFYVWTGTVLHGSASVNGSWQGQASGCTLSLSAPANLASGVTYKFAISGRRGSTAVAVRLEHLYR